MGTRGPVPNRSEDLARPRERKGGDQAPVTKGKSRPVIDLPVPHPDWHPIARLIWDSAIDSGQTDYYEASDYAVLYSWCDDVHYYKSMGKRSGQMLASIYGAMSGLLLTEGDRRRVRLELEGDEPGEDEATAEVMDQYEQGLHLVKVS